MAQFPAIPLFTDAVIADCFHLTDEEFGLYIRILMVMWRAPGCKIPASADWLEKRFKRPITVVGPILSEFCDCDGNWWTQGRLSDEMAWVKKNSKKQSDRAKSRWKKEKGQSRGNAPVHDDGIAPTPHPTPPISEPKGSESPTPSGMESAMVFETFWHKYPGYSKGSVGMGWKGSKKKAKEKFLNLWKEAKDHEQFTGELIDGCARYEHFLIESNGISKHATTWLNGRCWEDDYSSTHGPGNGGPGGRSRAEVVAEGFLGTLRDDGES